MYVVNDNCLAMSMTLLDRGIQGYFWHAHNVILTIHLDLHCHIFLNICMKAILPESCVGRLIKVLLIFVSVEF